MNLPLTSIALAMLWTGQHCAVAQEPPREVTPALNLVTAEPAKVQTWPAKEHRFWIHSNEWLFAGVGAARALDYFSTLNMRRRGRQEIFLTNGIADNRPAFALIEAVGTGASIGASYLFHRYGHHRLEHWTSIMHIGLATTGGVRNYSLKTAHPQTLHP